MEGSGFKQSSAKSNLLPTNSTPDSILNARKIRFKTMSIKNTVSPVSATLLQCDSPVIVTNVSKRMQQPEKLSFTHKAIPNVNKQMKQPEKLLSFKDKTIPTVNKVKKKKKQMRKKKLLLSVKEEECKKISTVRTISLECFKPQLKEKPGQKLSQRTDSNKKNVVPFTKEFNNRSTPVIKKEKVPQIPIKSPQFTKSRAISSESSSMSSSVSYCSSAVACCSQLGSQRKSLSHRKIPISAGTELHTLPQNSPSCSKSGSVYVPSYASVLKKSLIKPGISVIEETVKDAFRKCASVLASNSSKSSSKKQKKNQSKILKRLKDVKTFACHNRNKPSEQSPHESPLIPTVHNTSDDFMEDVEMTDVSVNMPSLDVLNEMQVDSPSADSEGVYFVLDTNILLSQLKFIDEFKDIPFQGYGLPHIYIPWTVMQELDQLKAKQRTRARVGEAVKYIYMMLSSKHPRFHGQTAKMAASCRKDYEECNDDTILESCFQLQEAVGKDRVILLTEDRNFVSKALLSDVKSFTMESLTLELTVPVFESIIKQNSSISLPSSLSSVTASVASSPLPPKQDSCSQNFQTDNQPEQLLSSSKQKAAKELDWLMQEAKLLCKCMLQPFLKEAILDAFGDLGSRFLPTAPCTLVDVLDHYKKYWCSVFSLVLPRNLESHFEELRRTFGLYSGCVRNTKQAITVLYSMETICVAIQSVSSNCQSDLSPQLFRIKSIIKEIRALQPKESQYEESASKQDSSQEVVLGVFHHIWDLMNQLCGMIMDFTGQAHDFVYTKPPVPPTKTDFQNLIPNLYPALHKIKKAYGKALNSSPEAAESIMRNLYDYLIQFIPSLQIQVEPPPLENFTVNALKQFFTNPNNRTLLQNGFAQLDRFHAKLEASIHDPVWKQ